MKGEKAKSLRVIKGGGAAPPPRIVPAPPPQLLTVAEVAASLHLSPKTVYNMASQGRIPFRKAGGKLLFEAREIEAWTKSRANNR